MMWVVLLWYIRTRPWYYFIPPVPPHTLLQSIYFFRWHWFLSLNLSYDSWNLKQTHIWRSYILKIRKVNFVLKSFITEIQKFVLHICVRLVAIFELCQQTWVRLISVFNPGAVLANQTSVLANQTSLLNEGYSYIIPFLKLNYKSVGVK